MLILGVKTSGCQEVMSGPPARAALTRPREAAILFVFSAFLLAIQAEFQPMPTYEYGCQKCGRQHEIVQKISDKALTRCPTCKGKLTRLLSASALQFKGSGWYVTDYAKKGSGAGKKDDEKPSGKRDGEKPPGKKEDEKPSGRKENGSKPAPASGD
jgi:putative FmdB family regulatory protein